MANDPQQDEVKKQQEDELKYPFLAEGLARSTRLQEVTPNWKQKLGAILLPMIIPLTNLSKDALNYNEEGIKAYDDIPEKEVAQMVEEAEVAQDAWSPYSQEFDVDANQSFEDIFNYQLGKMLVPELKVQSIDHLKEDKKAEEKFEAAIKRYKTDNPKLYEDMKKHYDAAVVGLNKENPIVNTNKIIQKGKVKIPDMPVLVAKAQFQKVADGMKTK